MAALRLGPDGHVADEFYSLLDPGCDPGPVHIHGLTREKLRGAPAFADISEKLEAALAGRVLVAHNAQLDYRFLSREFSRLGRPLPVPHRLCTLALANRIALPTMDIKLGTLAAHYSVPQSRAHHALDDARVLGGVLRALIADAARLGIAPPLLRCPPKESASGFPVMRTEPKHPCAYLWPGRFESRLVQGMKFAVTGDTHVDREDLVRRGEAAGLEGTSCVSRYTSVLISNDADRSSSKLSKAAQIGTPVLTEARFLSLLGDVVRGTEKRTSTEQSLAAQVHTSVPGRRLSAHRVLVIGGTHSDAARARARIVELGGSSAVNLSKTVTDILVLDGGEADPRMTRIRKLGLPVHGIDLLSEATSTELSESPPSLNHSVVPVSLQRGHVVDLPDTGDDRVWTVRASWAHQDDFEVDLVAFLTDSKGLVTDDADFIFYNQPEGRGARLGSDGPNEQSITIDLDQLPDRCARVVVSASIDADDVNFGQVGAIEVSAAPGLDAVARLGATLDAATEERSLTLAEIYLRGDVWRFRAVGQGYPIGLDQLAQRFGVEIDD